MTQDKANPNQAPRTPYQKVVNSSYYGLLGLNPSASVQDIRRAYRELSKLYHPDTTELPSAIATAKFQQLNEAYATLSSPERRLAYDQKIGYSRVTVIQVPTDLNRSGTTRSFQGSSAYLDPNDRPLSPGEIFALFILALTFVACLILAITIGITRGTATFHPQYGHHTPAEAVVERTQAVPTETISPAPRHLHPMPPQPTPQAAVPAVQPQELSPEPKPDPAVSEPLPAPAPAAEVVPTADTEKTGILPFKENALPSHPTELPLSPSLPTPS